MEILYSPYIKIIIIKIDGFYSEIIDEQNFAADDENAIYNFKLKYKGHNCCIAVHVDM